MMNHKKFQAWLSQVDQLSTAQSREAEAVLSGGSQASASLAAIEAGVGEDMVLVSEGHRAYPPCAAAMGVRHEALNLFGGERVRNAFHIQAVNSRHSQLKGFLRRYRGIATKYLDNCLR